jgi:hypothetical protein
MLAFQERLSAAGIVLALLCNPAPAFARGSQVAHDDPWNPEHIERLPPDIRNVVIGMCRDHAHAGHYFAVYFDNSHLMKLHFEHLNCDGQAAFCRGDSCLHQDYASAGGHYRLIRSYYGRGND